MNDVIGKLVADLKQRLGKKNGPKRKETSKWGAVNIPFIAPLMLSLAYMLIAAVGGNQIGSEGPLFWLLGPPGLLVFTFIVFFSRSRLNRSFQIKAYERLLSGNERFTLYEYCKYLKRQIEEAEQDPSLGGPGEVARLKELSRKLMKHLREGSKEPGKGIASTISEEAQMAESILEAYDLAKADPLKDLDSRLPEEVREEIERFDRGEGIDGRRSELE